MSQRFITVDSVFLARLVSTVQKKHPDIQDLELSQAVATATKKDQRSEALWLRTVPAAIENVRREAKQHRTSELRSALTVARQTLETALRLDDEDVEELRGQIAQLEAELRK